LVKFGNFLLWYSIFLTADWKVNSCLWLRSTPKKRKPNASTVTSIPMPDRVVARSVEWAGNPELMRQMKESHVKQSHVKQLEELKYKAQGNDR